MSKTNTRIGARALLVGLALLTAACEQERNAYALTSTGRILSFDTVDPTDIRSEVRVSGLPADESLVQLDYRPATGTFYCITSELRLCTVVPETGAVTLVSQTAFAEDLANPVIDFNPRVDRLRVISSEQNLRVDPSNGSLLNTDVPVAYDNDDVNDNRTPQLAAIAYDRNENGAAATTLFGLDVTTRSLVRIGSRNGSPDSPDTGRLFTLGQLPVSFTLNSGFDIEPEGDTAYAALSGSGSGSVLYRIDLDDGSADRVDVIDEGNQTVISLTIGPEDDANSN